MRSYEFPYPEAEQQTVVSRFGGIDCRTHPTKVSLSRSPDMQNMICDQNDFLVKRTGWRTQAQFNAPIYGLFAMPDGVGCAVHAGAKLYFRAPDGTQTELCADMNEAFSQSFTMKGVLYLMDGKTYRAVRKSSKKYGLGSRFRIRHSLCADHDHLCGADRRRHQLRGSKSLDA